MRLTLICQMTILIFPLKKLFRLSPTVVPNNPFDKTWNLSYYDSDHGLDLTKKHHIGTPIFNLDSNSVSLVKNLYHQLITKVDNLNSEEIIDFSVIAHSMGGLVIRALVQYKTSYKNGIVWLTDKVSISTIALLGTPNHGTNLAKEWITIPAEIIIDTITDFFSIISGSFSLVHINNNSQMAQMVKNSRLLKELNKKEGIEGVKVITLRGMDNRLGLFPNLWEPFFFWKIRIDSNFPWIHIGVIKNDGIVHADSVPLKGKNIKNYTVIEANHQEMLNWITDSAGIQVKEKILKHFMNNGN
ncbi:MAG: hypothetical protein HeimC3_53070 [Candidatus Heimdallarchaeota archaeon LC_3]|nr:MAG: hypothetical protein HeimC3_53070 [Candidatus Heimdallarchaeota archaeon LC_3]